MQQNLANSGLLYLASSAVTSLRYVEKCGTRFVENFMETTTAEEFWKWAHFCQS